MSGRAQLIIAETVRGDIGIVRVDQATMTYIGVKPGDEIDIFGEILSEAQIRAKVMQTAQKDEGKGIIRIAKDKMIEGNFKVGMKVIVYKSWIETLKLALSLQKSNRMWVEIEAPEMVTETPSVITEKK
ncbi:MAG: hypothetical protein L6N96_06685 [Candidatus Methylarchaceae archaeon HK02M2]|nr:hypothetical protein [Candidatus Methylarchaceae archaeon HK02M2]